MQWKIPFQKQSFLFPAGKSAGEPGGEDEAQHAQAGQAEEGQVQRVQTVRPFHIFTQKLDIKNSPISQQIQQAENMIICEIWRENTGMR